MPLSPDDRAKAQKMLDEIDAHDEILKQHLLQIDPNNIRFIPNDAETPHPKDMFTLTQRVAHGFGQDSDRVKSIKDLGGFTAVKRNNSGDLVGQDENGVWWKDANNFGEHPLNWMEEHLGGSLPAAGQIVGDTLGGVPGGALLAGAGDAARIGLGKLGGVNSADPAEAAKSIGTEAALGGLTSGIAKALPAIGRAVVPEPVRANAGAFLNFAKNSVQDVGLELGQKIFGVTPDAALRAMARPTEVGAANGLNKETVGELMRLNRNTQQDTLGKNVEYAKRGLKMNSGDELVSTKKPYEFLTDVLRDNQPNSSGYGAMSPDELAQLQKLHQDLLTPVNTLSRGNPLEPFGNNVIDPQPIYGETPMREYTPVESIADPFRGRVIRPTGSAVQEPIGPAPQTGWTGQLPIRPLDWTLSTADDVGQQEAGSFGKSAVTQRSAPFDSVMKKVYGKLKAPAHAMDDTYSDADAAYNQFKTKAKVFPELNKPETAVRAVNKVLNGPSAMADAAGVIAPETAPTLLDMRAAQQFGASPFSKGALAGRMGRGVVTTALGTGSYGAYRQNDPLLSGVLGAGALAAGAFDPYFYGVALRRGAQAAPLILRGAGAAAQNLPIWSLLNSAKNKLRGE